MSLKKVLFNFSVVSSLLLLTLAISTYQMLSAANNRLDTTVVDTTYAAEQFAEAKFHIIQIQQFITDSAATGEADGVADARASLEAAKTAVRNVSSRLATIAPREQSVVATIDADAQSLFDTGVEMLTAYRAGQAQGNEVMKRPGGFDEKAAQLADKVDQASASILTLRTNEFEALDAGMESALHIIILVSVVMLMINVTGAIWLWRMIFSTLGAEPSQATELAEKLASGDLTLRSDQSDILPGSTYASLLAMRRRWTDLATSLRGQAMMLSGQSRSMATQSHALSHSCEQQQVAAHGIGERMASFRSASQLVTDDVRSTSLIVNAVGRQAQENVEIVSQVRSEIQQLSSAIDESSNRIAELDARAADIASIVTVIRGIAEQTNLLALNAAIEAARAGESGRGFAVVADEVRSLAARTSTSTTDITRKIAEVHDSTKHIVASIRRAVEQVGGGVVLAEQATQAMRQIQTASQEASEQVRRIENAVLEQDETVNAMHGHVSDIELATQSNASAAEKVSQSSDQLSQLAEMIESDVLFFKLESAN